MQRKVIYSELALLQLQNIYDYILNNSLKHNIAEKYVTSLQEFINKLGIFPFIGTLALKNNSKIRTVGFKKRVTIVFHVGDEQVTINGIFYGGQQVQVSATDG